MKNDLRKMKSKTSTDTTSLLKVSDSTRLELVRLDSRGKLRTGRYQLFFGLGILKITFLMSTARWTWDLMVGSLLAGSSDVVETDSGGGRPGGMIQMGVWKLWEFASGRLLGGLLTAELLDEEVEIMIRLMGWIGFKLTGIVLLLMSMYNFYTSFSLYEEYKRGMAQIQLRQRDRETKGKDLHPFQSVLQQDTTLTYAERMKKNRIYVPVLKDPVENMGQDVRMKDERQGVLHSTPQLSDSNDRFNFNGLSTPLASMSTWNAGSFSLPGIDNLKLSSTMRNMGSPTAGYSTPQAQAHLPATLGSGMFSPSRLDQTNSMTPTRVSSGLSGLKPTADIGLPGIGSSSGVMAPIPFSGLQMNHPPYHTNTGSAGMLTNSFFTPTHSQDASNTGYPHGLHYDDEEAYHLLGKLKITWMTDSRIGSISTKEKPPPTVDDYIDDWTEEFRQYMRSYIINEVLLKFEKNCNDILNLLLDENFTKLFNPVRNKNEEARLTRILSFESDEEEDDKEMERLLQQCQILVLSATNNQLRSQLEERYSTLKRLLFERKRFERYFRLVRYVSNSHEIKGYVLRRLEALINSGKTMPQYRWCDGQNYRSQSFNVEKLPTDAEILFNVASVWMDNVLRDKSFLSSGVEIDFKHRSFYQLHVRDLAANDLASLRNQKFWGILIATPRTSLQLTHYKLMVEGKVWEVRSGRLNVFHTFLLLIYSMKYKEIKGVEKVEELVGGKSYKKRFSYR